ncbi:unnamed protein product [Mytilus coruscus]|uniref:Core-binding (CB) domain-containing protein n=1 Tax=Mytilus coruscus TaxID=42192 RepID=A0A6J8DI05_MYTCO|nr:unnamed protein product [Mytilus coruscus]
MEETNRISEEELESDSVGITGSTGNQIRDTKMARSGNKSSTSKSKKRSSKTAELEMKLFSIEESFDKRFDKCFGLLQAANKSADSSNTGGSATQENDVTRMDNVPVQRERRRLIPLDPNLNEDLGSPRIVRDVVERSEISLQVDRRERRDLLGLISDHEESDTQSVSSHLLDKNSNVKKTDRFSKYLDSSVQNISTVTVKVDENSSGNITCNNKVDRLAKIFKDDLPEDNSDKSVCLILDDSQVKILSYSWRTQHPERLSAYKDEYRSFLPVHEKSLPVLQVPSLDDMLEPMIKRVHTNKTVKSWDKQKQLFSQPVKQIEKLSYSGQVASRMGMISNSYMQQALGTLLGNLENDNASLEKQLEKRKEQREQLEDLLPEFHKTNKRKLDYDSRDSWSNKQSKFAGNSTDNNYNNNYKKPSFNTNRKSSIQSSNKSLQRGGFGNKDKKDKDAKTSNSAPSSLFLETSISRVQNISPSDTTSQISSNLVVKFSEHAERPLFATSIDLYNHNYRCFKNRLWGCNGQEFFSRGMVCFREQETHKLPGIRSSSAYNQTFSKLSDREICTDKIRQHNSGPVHQQTRGDQITSVVLQNLGTLDFSNSIQYNPKSSSYNGKEKHNCRLSEQENNSAYRVVTEHSNYTEPFSLVGPTSDGFICLGREPSDESVLLMDSTSPSFCLGCPDNILGENVCLRISPNLPDTQDIAIYEAVPVSDSPDSSFVAQETPVPGITSTIDRLPSQSPDTIRPFLSTDVPSLSSGPGGIQPDCLASINRSFQAEGFSKEARNLLSASWRKGTQKDYSAKFKKYCSWCSTREINPQNATLNQVADFLAYLFESGLQYRTIAGYRSMLSNVLPQVDNTAVGQHPYITRFIKGRCSDLQSLRVNHFFMRIQQKGITFIRCGLAKQDRQNHRNSKIVVSAFTDNKKLDPVTCLLQYIERTKKFRSSLDKDQQGKLFLSTCEPHKPVTSQTISKWIVQVIKLAYRDSSLENIKAHSTRAIGPSWALYKGASINSILEAADWSSESTFGKFYLRDLSVDVLDNL